VAKPLLAMERIATAKARKQFAEVIKGVGRQGKRYKVTHYGKTLVGIISAKDLEMLEHCESTHAEAARRRRPSTRR
jgi:hypothetical protein